MHALKSLKTLKSTEITLKYKKTFQNRSKHPPRVVHHHTTRVATTNATVAKTHARFRPGHEYVNTPTAGNVDANNARGAAPGQACFLFLPSSIHSGVLGR